MNVEDMTFKQYHNLVIGIRAFARTTFTERGGTVMSWPTVREVARKFRVRQHVVMDICEDDLDGDDGRKLMTTGHNFVEAGQPGYPGDLFVELC